MNPAAAFRESGMAGKLGMRWRKGCHPTRHIGFRVSPAVWQQLKEVSAERGIPVSDFLRGLVKGVVREVRDG